MSGIENKSNSHESRPDHDVFKQSASEHLSRLREKFEKEDEAAATREKNIADVQAEAVKSAESQESAKYSEHAKSSPQERHGPITKQQLDRQFEHTMKYVREELPKSSRTFSKIIHNKPIEKASDFLSTTIARPNAMLAGAIGAFTLTLAIYIFAKTMGYRLSGFEPIAAFIIGWIIGQLYDYFKIMITGKRDS